MRAVAKLVACRKQQLTVKSHELKSQEKHIIHEMREVEDQKKKSEERLGESLETGGFETNLLFCQWLRDKQNFLTHDLIRVRERMVISNAQVTQELRREIFFSQLNQLSSKNRQKYRM